MNFCTLSVVNIPAVLHWKVLHMKRRQQEGHTDKKECLKNMPLSK